MAEPEPGTAARLTSLPAAAPRSGRSGPVAALIRPLAWAGIVTTLAMAAAGPAPAQEAGMTGAASCEAAATAVAVSEDRILVDGRPFAVRGAAGDGPLPLLAGLGATTLRTYGGDPGPALDAAQRAGLKVIVGLWLGHPRQGANYADRGFVEAQLSAIRATVVKYCNHPALLMWGIGNEVEVDLADDSMVWPAIEEAAALVRSLDPAHPRMAVLAEIGGDKVSKIKQMAPSIDVLGVNSYGDALLSLPKRVRDAGWSGPTVVVEMGALGHWQAATSPWGAPFEPSSTQKAIQLRRYFNALQPAGIGVIAFLWGQKQEVTASWYGILLADGEWTEPAEAMAESWGGRTPGGNHAPRIAYLRFAHDASAPFASWRAGEEGAVVLEALDPDGDPLEATWEIVAESTVRSVGGDPEPAPRRFPEGLLAKDATGARIGHLPPGRYRITLVLRDGRGGAATANLPFELR
ncbi:glycosyl hydrolase [Bosea sp. 117]|uniref:glycosyl hydrolase n=1 Tax=Bosea sp. 117 TaxID=1125973 RepID=UPI00068D9F82|nr:glycosyl hydrolase [Bosea sp. 117]